ncbi:MAG: type II 3-dehydroquinate dehydratase [Burkholderiaceae bacterium]
MKHSIWVIHGPNLNLLGSRETDVYGKTTLAQINSALEQHGYQQQVTVNCFQSNTEGLLVDHIQLAQKQQADFIIINPAAYTHTSVAIRDALAAVQIPFIEVHLSNIYRREAFRHHSFVSAIAMGTVAGLGPAGYRLALDRAIEHLANNDWPQTGN